jgi:hypothetical protein
MSTGTRIGLLLFGAWLLGFIWLGSAGDGISKDARTIYLFAPFWAPFAAIAVLSVLIWIGEAFQRIRRPPS